MGFYSPTSCALPFTDELPLSGLLSEFSVAKLLPKTMNSSHYRFPAQGQSYIEIPHEAFRNQGECCRQPRALPRTGCPGSPRRPRALQSGCPAEGLPPASAPVPAGAALGQVSVLGNTVHLWKLLGGSLVMLIPSPLQPPDWIEVEGLGSSILGRPFG